MVEGEPCGCLFIFEKKLLLLFLLEKKKLSLHHNILKLLLKGVHQYMIIHD
jgi:hypothetical protein